MADAFRPVQEALGDALARLAELGVTARTYFNAREGSLIVWLERPESEAGGGE